MPESAPAGPLELPPRRALVPAQVHGLGLRGLEDEAPDAEVPLSRATGRPRKARRAGETL